MTRITILMASYNGAAHIGAQLESLAAQSHRDWRLIVSDDGSSDATCAIVEAFAARLPGGKVRLVPGPRQGATVNFLTLLTDPQIAQETAGDFIAFADQDDIWHLDKLAKALETLAALPEDAATLYGCRVNIITEDGQFLREGPKRPRGPSLQNAMVQNIVGGHGAVLSPAGAALLRAATQPPFAAFHDWWLYLMIMAAGGVVVLDPEVRLDYRQHDANVLGTNHHLGAKLKRLRWLGSRDISRWIGENIAALEGAMPYLTPQARAFLADFKQMRAQRGFAALRTLHRLKLHRQSRLQSLALLWGAWRGQL